MPCTKAHDGLPPHTPSHHPRAGQPTGTAVRIRTTSHPTLTVENPQGATPPAEGSLRCLHDSHLQCERLDRLADAMGRTSACGRGGKFAGACKSALELMNPPLPSLDCGTSSFHNLWDEELEAFIFSSITAHSARLTLFSMKGEHWGEMRGCAVLVVCLDSVQSGAWHCGRGRGNAGCRKRL